jgi:ZIP family zinc transporter
MIEALVIGAIAQSSLLLTAMLVYVVKLPTKFVGQLAGLGAGALIGSAAFELVPEALISLSNPEIGIWLLLGAAVYVVADTLVERKFGDSGAMGIVVGNINDALPESLIFGIQLGAGLVLSVPFVAAVWVSNIPQVIPPAADLAEGGWSRAKQAALWGTVVAAAGLAAALGFWIASEVAAANGARLAAFTIGGLIAMLTTSMIPFAYEKGGLAAGMWAVVGFGLTLASS